MVVKQARVWVLVGKLFLMFWCADGLSLQGCRGGLACGLSATRRRRMRGQFAPSTEAPHQQTCLLLRRRE